MSLAVQCDDMTEITIGRQLEDQLVVRNGQSGIIAVDVGFAAGLVSVRLADAAVHNDE